MKSIENSAGKTLSVDEVRRIEQRIGLKLPAGIVEVLTTRPLVGLNLVLDESADESGLGADFRWMTGSQILSEAMDAYPGIVATRKGFLPIGVCLEGSGDPYFLRVADGAIVRIPHDAATENSLDLSRVELVASSVDMLMERATIG